ncbi:glycosyltransferase family 4 protein [Bacillus sp. V3]|nr:glycosyltransferase family 4 protein [Bacillus sp. V3]
MKPVKMLLISNMYPSKSAPFYGTFVKKTVEFLEEDESFYVDKIVMYRNNGKVKKIASYIYHYLKVVKELVFSRKQYDVVYIHYASHNALPILFSKIFNRRLRIVANVHGSDVVPENNKQKIFQPLVRTLLRISKKVIVPSEYFAALVKEKYRLIPEDIYISPSGGIDNSVFCKKPPNYEQFNLDPSKQYMGYIGRIDTGKGWEDFIKSIKIIKDNKKLSDTRFIIVGNGKQHHDMVNLIRSYDLESHIDLFDLMPRSDLAGIYNVLDAFVFPTKREGESLGLVGIEAMACGCPVLGSEIGGLKSYIKDGVNGLFHSPGNIGELSKNILILGNMDRVKYTEFQQNAIETASQYNQEKVGSELVKLFKELTDEKLSKRKSNVS